MPNCLQPQSLRELTANRIVAKLIKMCKKLNRKHPGESPFDLIKRIRTTLRPYYSRNNVPSALRQLLVEKIITSLEQVVPESYSKCLANNFMPAYIFNILMDSDIKELRLVICCYGECNHKKAILQLLASDYVKGLKTLELTRSKMSTFQPKVFKPIMMKVSQQLTTLILQNICNDELLKIIGKTCDQLMVLDVSQSYSVTDKGVKALLQHQVKGGPYVRPNLRIRPGRPKNVVCLNESRLKLLSGDIEEIDGELIREFVQQPTKACFSLRKLDVSETKVTDVSIVRALLCIPNLKSFGEYTNVGKAIEFVDKCTVKSNELQLITVSTSNSTAENFQSIRKMCPKLQSMIVNEPSEPPEALCNLPEIITKLCLRSIPGQQKWLDGLYKFLSKPGARNICELSLRFKQDDNLPCIDLGAFLYGLTGLKSLGIHGLDTTFSLSPKARELEKLKKIRISKFDHSDSLQRLMICAPKLEVLHLFSCLNLNKAITIDLLKAGYTKDLKCFYIDELIGGDVNLVANIIKAYPKITCIGNISNWSFRPLDESLLSVWVNMHNYNLSFPRNFHWYYSECFAKCQVYL